MAQNRVVEIFGGTGRLGQVLARAFTDRGDAVRAFGREQKESLNSCHYIVFAQRYRWLGEQDAAGEFNASVVLTQRVLESARFANGDNAVVVVSSVAALSAGIRAAGTNFWYAAGKAATVRLALEWARAREAKGGPRVNVVSPAAFTGLDPVVSIEEVANVILFLCSPQSSGVNGQNIIVNRGRT